MSSTTQVRAARKTHICTFCRAPIQQGEPYVRHRLTPWDHAVNESFFTWRAHPYCDDLWSEVGHDWEWEWDEAAWQEFRECGDERAPWAAPTDKEAP